MKELQETSSRVSLLSVAPLLDGCKAGARTVVGVFLGGGTGSFSPSMTLTLSLALTNPMRRWGGGNCKTWEFW